MITLAPFSNQIHLNTLQDFILSSSYWGDEFALKAIKDSLGLVIIPIILDNNNIPNIVNVNISEFGDNWSHYMFLYLTIMGGGHWELIQFNYGKQIDDENFLICIALPWNLSLRPTAPPQNRIPKMMLFSTSTDPRPCDKLILMSQS